MTDNTINMDDLPIEEQIKILNRLAENWTKPINIDGALKSKEEVRQYLNDWRSNTPDGLKLRSRQVREDINIFKFTLTEHIKSLTKSDIDLLNNEIKVFELLLERISIRLEKFQGQPELPKKPQKKAPEGKTYLWTKQPDIQLPELYKRLIEGGFIASETSSETFTACFTGKPVQNKHEKIRWLESKVLLAYFLDCLIKLKKLPVKTKLWSIAEIIFDEATNLKQAKANYVSYGFPNGYERINEILKNL